MVMLVLSVFTACSTKSSQTPSQPSQESKTSQTSEQSKPIKVAVITKALNSDFWKLVEAGAKAAGKDLGVEVTVLGPSTETDVTGQFAMIEDQIAKKVSALAIAPSQPESAIPFLEKAKAAGIPVVLIDTDANWDGKVSYVGTGNYEAGRLGAEFIAEKLGPGGKVAILEGIKGVTTSEERVKGATDVFKEKGLKILAIQPANWERGMGMSVMENILQAHPDVQGVFAANDEMALGAVRAIQAANKKIIVVGVDGTPDALKSIAAGELTASVAQKPYDIGYKGVEAAVKAVKGEPVDKRIDTGTYLITKDNVKEEQQKLNEILGK